MLSSSTDQFDKSYEDDRRNLIESIKNILIAKLEAIQKTIPLLDLTSYLTKIKGWRFDQNVHSGHNLTAPHH